jgi:hypothetical protein
MSEWQPIETAPKDGNEVLVHADGFRWVAGFDTEQGEWDWPSVWHNLQPTHWMPLPAPPPAQARERQAQPTPEAIAPPEGPTTALTDSVNDLRLGDEVCHRNYPTKRGVVFKIGTDFVRVRWSDGQIGDLVWRRDVAHSAFNLDPLRRDPAPSARPDAAPHTCMGGDPGSSLNGPCRACDLERGESR